MESIKGIVKHLTFLKKYRPVILILIIGIILMCIPTKRTATQQDHSSTYVQQQAECSVAEELSQILSQIDGVGNAKVILSTYKGEEMIYQTDQTESTGADSTKSDCTTVIISGSDRGEQGLIRQVIPPSYLGAIVVCEGGDNPQVRLSVVDAVAKFTGLGANRISVMKMK